jgi:hypothetical protein
MTNKIIFDKEFGLKWKTRNVWTSKFLVCKSAASYTEKYPEAYVDLEEEYFINQQTGEDIFGWAVSIRFSLLADEAVFIMREIND